MGERKSDIECMGGKIRLNAEPARGKYDGVYRMLDPDKKRPYTNAGLDAALRQREKEQPALAPMIRQELLKIEDKVRNNPNAEFKQSKRAETKEKALAMAKKELLPQIEEIAKILYRPQWVSNVTWGNVTVAQYVNYMGDDLYQGVTMNTRSHLMSCLHTVILPQIGDLKLRELDSETQQKVIKKINRVINQKKASASQRSYVKRSYKGLFESIESSGYNNCSAGIRLADMIDQVKRKNRALIDSLRVSHLDDGQRENLFALLKKENLLYELFLLSMVYCGLEPCEIAALYFRDIEELVLRGESCYLVMVSRMMRKHQHYSTISAVNEEYPIRRLRKVVFYPWAADVMHQYLDSLRGEGYTDAQIAQMRFSDPQPESAIVGPDEIEKTIKTLMQRAGIPDTQIPRTRKDGSVYFQVEAPGVELLRRDADYIAKRFCGANRPMRHAMFGGARTEMDEEAYLDLLSDQYAVARYLHLKRFSPWEQKKTGKITLKVKNDTLQPHRFTVSSDYGVVVGWEEL